jgi:hypothetical protein
MGFGWINLAAASGCRIWLPNSFGKVPEVWQRRRTETPHSIRKNSVKATTFHEVLVGNFAH